MNKIKKFLEENKDKKKFIYNFLMIWALIAGPYMWLAVIVATRDLKETSMLTVSFIVSLISGIISWFFIPYWLGIYTINLLLTMILFSDQKR